MPLTKFTFKNGTYTDKRGEKNTCFTVTKADFDRFNSTVLGLGNVSKEGRYFQALACLFDLQGFTNFCNQIDSHLVIPEFLERYLEWLFRTLAGEFKQGHTSNRVRLWGTLPMFAKFMGDGILFLWDTSIEGVDATDIRNIVVNLNNVRRKYRSEFLSDIREHLAKPPSALRCGVARGQVISVGDGEDFVGSCINLGARLQKLSNLTFAVSKRGFEKPEKRIGNVWDRLVVKKVQVRGVGDDELVYVLKDEWEKLDAEQKKLFKEPSDE